METIDSKRAAGARVTATEPDSAARAAGLEAGDLVLSLDGKPLTDILDYQFRMEPGAQLEVDRDGRCLTAVLDYEEEAGPGLLFEQALFDGVRSCRNRCLFCFVDQLPGGLRRPLYLKDDDYRLSMLHGNFITLNNLKADDLERIIAQRIGPLYVSVHATDPDVRGRLMGCNREAAALGLARLRKLGEAGIRLHAQIVLCPGFNDGEVLEATVRELAAEYPGVRSAGIVPVAVPAQHRPRRAASGDAGPQLQSLSHEECRKVVNDIEKWQEELGPRLGSRFVYAADELYLRGGCQLPSLDCYEDLSHYENGIGIAAGFLAASGRLAAALTGSGDLRQFIDTPRVPDGGIFLLTGELAAPLLEYECQKLSRGYGRPFAPLEVANRLFGRHVTVTGLLGGQDIAAAAIDARLDREDLLLIPSSCLDAAGDRFLDDETLTGLRERMPCTIAVVR